MLKINIHCCIVFQDYLWLALKNTHTQVKFITERKNNVFSMLQGKLPPMIGQDMSGNRPLDSRVQLSAGDLLGRTHEELVLLLIQLRRQSSALLKARDACLLEMESQVCGKIFFLSLL